MNDSVEGENKFEPDPWATPESAIREIETKNKPINLIQMLENKQILFLGKHHFDFSPDDYLDLVLLDQLQDAGVTHFALELDKAKYQATLDRLNQGEDISIEELEKEFGVFGEIGKNISFDPFLVKGLAKKYIKLVAIDTTIEKPPPSPDYDENADDKDAALADFKAKLDQWKETFEQYLERFEANSENREQDIADNFTDLFKENPQAKVACLIGRGHVYREIPIGGEAKTIRRRMEDAGLNVASAVFQGGDYKLDSHPSAVKFNQNVQKAGLADDEFQIDLRSYKNSQAVPYGPGEVDYLIHLLQMR